MLVHGAGAWCMMPLSLHGAAACWRTCGACGTAHARSERRTRGTSAGELHTGDARQGAAHRATAGRGAPIFMGHRTVSKGHVGVQPFQRTEATRARTDARTDAGTDIRPGES